MPLPAHPPANAIDADQNTEKYRDLVEVAAGLEKKAIKTGLTPVSADLRAAYSALLENYPLLEGFWVRKAHFEFRTRGFAAGEVVFREALKVFPLQSSVVLQTEHLRFQLRLGNLTPIELRTEFIKVSKSIGTSFLAHEFWDLYLEIADEKAAMLIYIMDHCTLHQFAKYYAQLLTALDTEGVAKFAKLLKLTDSVSQDEEMLVKQVVQSKLQLKYELHLRRVNQVWEHFQHIKRFSFYPKACLDSAKWLACAQSATNPALVLQQALIPCYNCSDVWLAHLRLNYRANINKSEQQHFYEMGIRGGGEAVVLHYALWLELHNEVNRAKQVYELVKSESGLAQKAQFYHRLEGTPLRELSKAPTLEFCDNEVYTEDDVSRFLSTT